MNAEWKKRWVEALRSGNYAQGQSYLQKDGKYCCLGVLRELIAPGSTLDADGDEFMCDEHEEIAGLTRKEQEDLAQRNDGSNEYCMHTFLQLADHIEANL